MSVIILGGIGNGDWLPILWMLLGVGIFLQIADWSIKFLRKRRTRNLMQHEVKRVDDDTSFFSDN